SAPAARVPDLTAPVRHGSSVSHPAAAPRARAHRSPPRPHLAHASAGDLRVHRAIAEGHRARERRVVIDSPYFMDFGVFVEQIRRGNSAADAFREISDTVDAAESWGLDIVWLAEMLLNPARSVLSAPLLVASWVVARTRRLRAGTAVQL